MSQDQDTYVQTELLLPETRAMRKDEPETRQDAQS